MWRLVLLGSLLVLVYVLVKLVWRSLRRDKETVIVKAAEAAALPSEMIQDPICGVFVPKERAVCFQHDEQALFFCSDTCRADYQKKLGSA